MVDCIAVVTAPGSGVYIPSHANFADGPTKAAKRGHGPHFFAMHRGPMAIPVTMPDPTGAALMTGLNPGLKRLLFTIH